MNAFRNLVKQLSAIWTQAGPAQRAALAAAGVLLATAIIGVGIWSARPQYVALASGLQPNESAALTSRLESEGIKYRLSLSGSRVDVSQRQYSTARLAASELLEPDNVEASPVDGGILADPSLNGHRISRQLEFSLAKTIQQFRGVESATVHIGRPPSSPFIKQRDEVTASVVLALKRNGGFTGRQANAVVLTVARAVDGLLPQNVTVSDTHGRPLSRDGGVGADIAGQLEYRQQVETDLASSAELMLSQLLGFGRAVVRVTADIDFTRTTRESTVIDPDSKIRSHEVIVSEERSGGPTTLAQGPAGAQSNAAGAPSAASKGDGDFSMEQSTSEYAFGHSKDTINEAAGKIKRLTIAAVVDLGPLQAQENAPEITQEQLEGIIKQAVGFDPSRQDEIELLLAPLATAPTDETPVPVAPWAEYEVLVRNASLGVGGLAALILGFLILKKVQPPAPNARNTTLDTRRARALASMSESVRRNPDQLKDALRAWLLEEQDDEETRSESPEKRAEAAKAA